MSYRLLDLFCGAGGMTLGFCDRKYGGGGFKSILAIDNDESAIETYQLNLAKHAVQSDISEWLSRNAVPQADVVIGGPPCQGFSLLNAQRNDDERRKLWHPFLKIVAKSKAKVFVLENVAAFGKSPEIRRVQKKAASLGYKSKAMVLNAADYGTPQIRKRTILIGWLDNEACLPKLPPKTTHCHPDYAEERKLLPWITVLEAIGDLPLNPSADAINMASPLDLHFGRSPTKLSLTRYRLVPPGGNRFDLQRRAPELTPPCWIKKSEGGTDLFGRLWWDRPSVTIRTEFFKPEKGRYLHPTAHRSITHREAARLMGFPDDFRFSGSKAAIARQIGNAVPPQLAGAIAAVVRKYLREMEKVETSLRHCHRLVA